MDFQIGDVVFFTLRHVFFWKEAVDCTEDPVWRSQFLVESNGRQTLCQLVQLDLSACRSRIQRAVERRVAQVEMLKQIKGEWLEVFTMAQDVLHVQDSWLLHPWSSAQLPDTATLEATCMPYLLKRCRRCLGATKTGWIFFVSPSGLFWSWGYGNFMDTTSTRRIFFGFASHQVVQQQAKLAAVKAARPRGVFFCNG